MSHPTEFRPVAHEFFSEGFHGAAFVGAKAADAFWFYRFDSSFIEVRDTFTCHDKVFASLSTADIKQRFRHLLKSDQVLLPLFIPDIKFVAKTNNDNTQNNKGKRLRV